uniref:Uncharacterized protein n=1 Tax=Triticum urartu TaxID=4572 RepID=A0A8R7QUA2_TRIUA
MPTALSAPPQTLPTTAAVLHHQRPCRRRPYPLALSPYPRRRAGREEPPPRSTLAPVRTGGAPAGSEQEHRVVHVPGVPRSIRPTLCSPYLPRCWGIQIEQVRCRRSMISMRCAGEATVMLVVDASAVFHRHTAAPSDAALPRDERPRCRSAGTEPHARRCHGHGGPQGEADTHTASSCSLCLTASSCSLCLTASSCSTATSTDAHTGMTCVPPMTLHRCYVRERARLLQCRVRWCAANLRWGRPGGAWPCVW